MIYMNQTSSSSVTTSNDLTVQEDEWKEEEELVQDFEGLRVQKLDKGYVETVIYFFVGEFISQR